MNFEVQPNVGAGKLLFGMSRDTVRQLLDEKPQSFKRSAADQTPCDHFSRAGVFAYFNDEDALEALEFSRPALAIFDGVDLLGLTFEEARRKLRSVDAYAEEEADGVIASAVGVSVYAPLAKSNVNAPVESAVAFAPGYYGRNN